MALVFTKTNETLYTLSDATEAVAEVDAMLDILSDNRTSEYQKSINSMLRDRMLARYIAARFFKDYIEALSATNYIVIDSNIGDRVLSITVGKTPVNGEKMDGVLYA